MNTLLKDAQAIIFDADGLLIDSEPLWDEARRVFAQKYDKSFPESFHMQMRGRGMKEVVRAMKKKLQIPGTVDAIAKKFRETFYNLALKEKKLYLLPGVKKIVSLLYKKGKKLAVATGGHPTDQMDKILKQFHLRKYFSFIVSSDEVSRGKPAPDIFLFTVKKLEITKSKCVILEDAANGVEAARSAHIKVIAVQQKEEMIEKIQPFHPTLLVSSLTDLL